MDKPRPCGCKGCRTCLICESDFGLLPKSFELSSKNCKSYVYCPICMKSYRGWSVDSTEHPNHEGDSVTIPGIYIEQDFLTEDEEKFLMDNIDNMPWDQSQSGRRKQNYGPKTNFKKKKIAAGNFNGFPSFSKFIVDKFSDVKLLKDYQSIEQCSLEYDPVRGASIDPHIDDCWIWGERIVTVNCLSDSVLTLRRYKGEMKRYNLDETLNYCSVIDENLSVDFNPNKSWKSAFESSLPKSDDDIVLRLPMPRRSIMVLYGEARYHWEHFVLREDITARRVCIAYREFTPPYLDAGEHSNMGEEVRLKAKNFWSHIPV